MQVNTSHKLRVVPYGIGPSFYPTFRSSEDIRYSTDPPTVLYETVISSYVKSFIYMKIAEATETTRQSIKDKIKDKMQSYEDIITTYIP